MASTVTERIFRGMAYTTLSRFAVQFFSVVSFFVFINALTLTEYGLLQILLTVLGPASIIVMFGIERLVVADGTGYRARGEHGHIRRMLLEYGTVATSALLVLLIVAWIFQYSFGGYFHFELERFYFALAVLIGGQLIMNFSTISFEIYERFDLSLYVQCAEAGVRLLVIVAFLLFSDLTIYTVLWSYALGKLASACLGVPLLFGCLGRVHVFATEWILPGIIRRHGKWEMASNYMKASIDSAVPWILAFFTSLEGVALVTFAMRVNSLCTSFFPVRAVLFPILAHSISVSKELAISVASKAKKYLFLLYVLIYAVVFVSIDSFISFAAPQYGGAAWLVRLAMLHLFVDVFTMGQSVAFYALKQQRLTFGINIYGTLATVVTQVVFTGFAGAYGYIASWLFVAASQGFLREYLLRVRLKYYLFSWRTMVSFDDVDRRVIREALSHLKGIAKRF